MTDLVLAGVMPPIPTPTLSDGALNRPMLEKLVARLLDVGVTGIIPIGSVGEYAGLAMTERVKVVEATVEAVGGRVPVIAGVVSPSFHDAVDAGRALRAAGADALLVLPAHYHNPPQAGIRAYFDAYRSTVDAPILLYDAPYNTHLVIEPETIAQMAEDGSIVGLKASNTDIDHFNRVMGLIPEGFPILSGESTHFPIHVAMGASGATPGNTCLMPEYFIHIYELAREGRLKEALAAQRKLFPLMSALSSRGYFGSFKQSMQLIGIDAGVPRLPLMDADESAFEPIRRAFEALREEIRQSGVRVA